MKGDPDDDEDMAWRDAVPMPRDDPFRQWTPADYAMQQQATLGQQTSHMLGQQMSLLQQQAMVNFYGQQGGMFNGPDWQTTQAFYGSSLGTANSAHAGWQSNFGSIMASTSSNGAIIGAYASLDPIEDTGIRAGEVAGFRCWQIGGRGRSLHSMVNNAEWPPDGIMRGDPGDHDGMGVHAFKSADEVLLQYGGLPVAHAFGRVVLWGSIVEHEDGYRAEFARITAIDEVHGVWLSWSLRRLRWHYGLTGNE